MRTLNLASRPFRNETLPKIGLTLASVLTLVLSLSHVRAIRRVLPRNTSQLSVEVSGLEEEGRRLREDGSRLRSAKADPVEAARWAILKDLVDRRVFPWTRLLAVLEESLPIGVRLVSVAPKVERGQFLLELVAVARSSEDGFEFIRALEERPEFSDVFPKRRLENEQGVTFDYVLRYDPSAAPPPTPAPSPSPEAEAFPVPDGALPGEGAAASPPPGDQP
jgi:hypothetical protein